MSRDMTPTTVTEPDGQEVFVGPASAAQMHHLNACGYTVARDGITLTATSLAPELKGGRARAIEQGHPILLVISERRENPFHIATASAPSPDALTAPGYAALSAFKVPVGMHIERLIDDRWKADLAYHFTDEPAGIGSGSRSTDL